MWCQWKTKWQWRVCDGPMDIVDDMRWVWVWCSLWWWWCWWWFSLVSSLAATIYENHPIPNERVYWHGENWVVDASLLWIMMMMVLVMVMIHTDTLAKDLASSFYFCWLLWGGRRILMSQQTNWLFRQGVFWRWTNHRLLEDDDDGGGGGDSFLSKCQWVTLIILLQFIFN